jgi:hypothetical protein
MADGAAVAEVQKSGGVVDEIILVGEASSVGACFGTPQRRVVRVRLTVKGEIPEREYECDVTAVPATALRKS